MYSVLNGFSRLSILDSQGQSTIGDGQRRDHIVVDFEMNELPIQCLNRPQTRRSMRDMILILLCFSLIACPHYKTHVIDTVSIQRWTTWISEQYDIYYIRWDGILLYFQISSITPT